MKKHLITMLMLATLSLGASAQEPPVRNGNWWQKLPAQEVKWGYLVGFFDGMGLGHRFSWWPLEGDDKTADCVAHVIDAYRAQIRQYLGKLDNQQLATELDNFYREPKNKPIKVADAIWVVVNQLAGRPAAEVEKMADEFRGR